MRSHPTIFFNQNQNFLCSSVNLKQNLWCGWINLRSHPTISFNQNQNFQSSSVNLKQNLWCGWINLRSHPTISFNQNQNFQSSSVNLKPHLRFHLTKVKTWDPVWWFSLTMVLEAMARVSTCMHSANSGNV
jgi:hypothetical protein